MTDLPVRYLKIDVEDTDAAREEVEAVLAERRAARLQGLVEAEAVLGRASGRKPLFKAEITLVHKGFRVRGEERAPRLSAAIRGAVDHAVSRARREIGKAVTASRSHPGTAEVLQVEPEEEPVAFARRKSVGLERIAPEEAVHRMERVGHTFYLFADEDGNPGVVYRRTDGTYGLLSGEAA